MSYGQENPYYRGPAQEAAHGYGQSLIKSTHRRGIYVTPQLSRTAPSRRVGLSPGRPHAKKIHIRGGTDGGKTGTNRVPERGYWILIIYVGLSADKSGTAVTLHS
ncbi:hypothetical protein E4U54_007250 [Claviceps lovelessii]|nr:hypothetical protein E4U54_007250 [Claviceps lovelessii]